LENEVLAMAACGGEVSANRARKHQFSGAHQLQTRIKPTETVAR